VNKQQPYAVQLHIIKQARLIDCEERNTLPA